MSEGTGGMRAEVYYCPFCAEEDLRPVEEPDGAYLCVACRRVFTVRAAGLQL